MSQSARDTHQSIVETAERFFREIGYQKTTVADIAKALKMSPANVYRFFESKKAINEAVLARHQSAFEAALAAIAGSDLPARQRLREMLLASHRLNAARFSDQQRIHEMVCAAMDESWDAITQHVARYDALLERVVREGIASGTFPPSDPAMTARCLRTAMVRFNHPLLLDQCAALPAPEPEMFVDFLLRALEAPGRA